MKETPIIMSGNHPKLILDGRKTQTRRVIKPQPEQSPNAECDIKWGFQYYHKDHLGGMIAKCPYGGIGDRLWVRETWATDRLFNKLAPRKIEQTKVATLPLWYKVADYQTDNPNSMLGIWRPSIFMPRWASRITLEITDIRVERVAEISEEDAIAEGSPGIATHKPYPRQYRDSFEVLWDSLNAKRKPTKYDWAHGITQSITPSYAWAFNPWVWAISFKVVK